MSRSRLIAYVCAMSLFILGLLLSLWDASTHGRTVVAVCLGLGASILLVVTILIVIGQRRTRTHARR